MGVYISILRGINVSGQKLIKMTDLVKHCEALGLKNVKTYIQSGNVIFQSPDSAPEKISLKIAKKIKKEYGFDVPVMVKSAKDLKQILNNNPFIERGENTNQLYVTFLSDVPRRELVNNIDPKRFLPEEFTWDKNVIYFFSPNGYGNAKMNNNFFENKLKVEATTRNWKTVTKLYEFAEQAV